MPIKVNKSSSFHSCLYFLYAEVLFQNEILQNRYRSSFPFQSVNRFISPLFSIFLLLFDNYQVLLKYRLLRNQLF